MHAVTDKNRAWLTDLAELSEKQGFSSSYSWNINNIFYKDRWLI